MREQVSSRLKMAVALFESYNNHSSRPPQVHSYSPRKSSGNLRMLVIELQTIQSVEVMLLPLLWCLAPKSVAVQNERNGRCCTSFQFSTPSRPPSSFFLSFILKTHHSRSVITTLSFRT